MITAIFIIVKVFILLKNSLLLLFVIIIITLMNVNKIHREFLGVAISPNNIAECLHLSIISDMAFLALWYVLLYTQCKKLLPLIAFSQWIQVVRRFC